MSDLIEDYVKNRHMLQYTDGPYSKRLAERLKVDIDAPYGLF